MLSRALGFGGKGQTDPRSTLLAILRQHGIEDSEVTGRYDMLCTKLGKDKVDATAASPNPWKSLKWLANQSIPPIQIVKPTELQRAIDHRAKSDAPLGRKKKTEKGKGKGKGKGVYLPSGLTQICLDLKKGFSLPMVLTSNRFQLVPLARLHMA